VTSAESSHQTSQSSITSPLSKETKKTAESAVKIEDASAVPVKEEVKGSETAIAKTLSDTLKREKSTVTSENAISDSGVSIPHIKTGHRVGAFSTQWLKKQNAAINDESGKNELLTILNEISSNAFSSSAVIRDFASATATTEGIKALREFLDSAGNNAHLSTTLCRIRAEASFSPEGINALKHLNSAASRNTELAVSLMKVMAIAAKNSEGLKNISTYGQEISKDPEISSSDIALRNQAVRNPEGALNIINLNVSLASHSDSASSDMSIYSAAAQSYDGINHIITYNQWAMKNQALSISEIRKYAAAAQTSQGLRNITQYLYYISKNSSASSSEIGKSAITGESSTGLKVLINYNNWMSTDPFLSSLELAKYVSALNLPEGLSLIERLNNILGNSTEASTSEVAKYAMALQSHYGIKYLAELNNGLSRSAGASASEIRKRVAAIENIDGGKHIETLYKELGKNKDTHSSESKMRASAVLVPEGLEKFKTYSKFLKSSRAVESPTSHSPQKPKEPVRSSVTSSTQTIKEPVLNASSPSTQQLYSEALTGREAAAQTLAAMTLDMETDTALSPESIYYGRAYEDEPSSGRDAALKTLEAINAIGDESDDEVYALTTEQDTQREEVSVWKTTVSQEENEVTAAVPSVQIYHTTQHMESGAAEFIEEAIPAENEHNDGIGKLLQVNQEAVQANLSAAQVNQEAAQTNQKAIQPDINALQVAESLSGKVRKVENAWKAQESAFKAPGTTPAQVVDALHSTDISTAAAAENNVTAVHLHSTISPEMDSQNNVMELQVARGNPLAPESMNINHPRQEESQVSAPEYETEQIASLSEAPVTSVNRSESSTTLESIDTPLPYIESESSDWLINDYIEVLNEHYEEWSFAIQEISPDNGKKSAEQDLSKVISTEQKKHSLSEHKEYLIADTIQDDEKRLYSLLSKPLTEDSLQLISVYVAHSMTEEQKQLFLSILNQKITDEKRNMVMHLLVNPLTTEERRMYSLFLLKNPNPESRELLKNSLTLDFTKEQKQILTQHLLKPTFQEQRKVLNRLITQNLTSSQKQWLISIFSRPLSEDMRQLIIRVLTQNISRENRDMLLSLISQSFSGEARNFLISLISQPMSQEQRQLLFLLINKNLTAGQKQNLIALLAGKASTDRVRQVILSFLSDGKDDGLTVRSSLQSGDSAEKSSAKKEDTMSTLGKKRLRSSLSHLNPQGESDGFLLCASLFPENTYRKKEDVSIIATKAVKKDLATVQGIVVEPKLLKNESIPLQRMGMTIKEIKERSAKAVSDSPARDDKLDRKKKEMEYEAQRKEIYLGEPEKILPQKKTEELVSLKAQLMEKQQETKPDRQLQDRDFGEEYIKYTHEHEDSFKTFKMESRVYQFVSYICEDILKKKFGLHDFKKEYFTKYMCFLLRTSGDFTFSHSLRTQSLSLNLAKRAGIKDRTVLEQLRLGALFVDIGEMEFVFNDAPDSKLDAIKGFLSDQDLLLAGVLHDIGKIKIPDSILYKPGKLSGEEFKVMRMHPIYSAMMLYPIQPLRHLCPVVRGHHEKWDGKGYPDGLAENNIPVASRIIAIADVFDALISDRPYKKGMPWLKVKKIMLEGRGTHFDPDLLDIFMEYVTPLYEI